VPIRLSFLGAARNVTGSQYLLEAGNIRVLVDCGLYQERELKERNWAPLPVPPDTLDAVLLTHAHIDHCGLLPRLVRGGFKDRIYTTAATADITEIMLLDAAKLQQEDAEFKKRRHQREGRRGPFPEIPLYTTDDAEQVSPHFERVAYTAPVSLGAGITATFHDAGHVLGSAMIKVVVGQGGEARTILFSGDVGMRNRPILRDRTTFAEADYVIVESTYGDRLHENPEGIAETLAGVINETLKAGGNIIVPSFALQRAQEIMYYLSELQSQRRIPSLAIFVDSPMASSITEVFERYPELYDEEMTRLMRQHGSPFEFPGLKMVQSVEESKAINNIAGGIMVIAGSGMCNGGRIKHHLVNNISRPQSTVLFVGYQAIGTLGRQIVDGAGTVRILGQSYPVRARIAQIQGFSAHADRDGLARWLGALKSAPRQVFITHGESQVADHFRDFLKEKTGWKVSVPDYRQEVVLE
jgi:metallo-beta-lactamase family protein